MAYIITDGDRYCHRTKTRAIEIVADPDEATRFPSRETADNLLSKATKKLNGFHVEEAVTSDVSETASDASAQPDTPAPADTAAAADTTVSAETAVSADTTVPSDTAVPADITVSADTAAPADAVAAADTISPVETSGSSADPIISGTAETDGNIVLYGSDDKKADQAVPSAENTDDSAASAAQTQRSRSRRSRRGGRRRRTQGENAAPSSDTLPAAQGDEPRQEKQLQPKQEKQPQQKQEKQAQPKLEKQPQPKQEKQPDPEFPGGQENIRRQNHPRQKNTEKGPSENRRRMFTAAERNMIYNRTEGHCGICGRFIPLEEYTIDHIIPLSKGGTNDPDNLQACCSFCNKAKDDSVGDDFFKRIERIYLYQTQLRFGKKHAKKIKKMLKKAKGLPH